jgi:hypothetical protein
MNHRAPVAAAFALAATALVLASCGKAKPSAPLLTLADGPRATSPEAAVSLVPWCWEHRDLGRYAGVLADDFRFVGAAGDSAGGPPPVSPWVREDELLSADHIFQGGPGHPRADAIEVSFSSPLVAQPDPRPGKSPRWHRVVRTTADAAITLNSGGVPNVIRVHGYAAFYVVRGDSARIPPGSSARPDSTTWWIERWEDETVDPAPAHGWDWLRRAWF